MSGKKVKLSFLCYCFFSSRTSSSLDISFSIFRIYTLFSKSVTHMAIPRPSLAVLYSFKLYFQMTKQHYFRNKNNSVNFFKLIKFSNPTIWDFKNCNVIQNLPFPFSKVRINLLSTMVQPSSYKKLNYIKIYILDNKKTFPRR